MWGSREREEREGGGNVAEREIERVQLRRGLLLHCVRTSEREGDPEGDERERKRARKSEYRERERECSE